MLPKQSLSVIDKTTAYGYSRVSEWAKKELKELQTKSKEPICLELFNGDYIVATYKVTKIEVGWQVEEHTFNDKRSAIFYASLLHLNKTEIARELQFVDAKVSVYETEKAFFRTKLDQAHLQNDEFRVGLFSSRFAETKNRLVQAKNELEKTLARAKYNMNLGNKLL
jgi:hypothetical protein